jgi:hypothetical protein
VTGEPRFDPRRRVKMGFRPFRRGFWLLAASTVGLALAGGIAYATIPDSGGVIHACFKPTDATKSGGAALNVVDSESGATCKTGDTALTFNQQGPPGPQGPPGVTRADERFFARSLADPSTWLPIVSGTWPDVRPVMTHVLTMHLDAGNYAVTAEMIAANNSGHGIVVCLFGNPTVGYTVAQSGVGNEAGFALQQTFEAQSTYALDSPTDLELSCFNAPPNDPAGTPRIGFADVIATKLNLLSSTQEQ